MYYHYWQLHKPPFDNVPDPSMYVDCHASLENAIAETLFSIEEGNDCLAVIVGDVGLGKTLSIRMVIDSLSLEKYRIAIVTNPGISFIQLLGEIVGQLTGAVCHEAKKSDLLEKFNQILFETADEGKKVLIFIDEANAITPANLESLRLLTNMQDDSNNLFTIILAGQIELARRLEHPKRANLFQRIGTFSRIDKIDSPEMVKTYIETRLKLAGGAGSIFTDDAVWLIWEYSEHGVPRLINKIAKLCLKAGETNGFERIEADIVRQIGDRFKNLTGQVIQKRRPRKRIDTEQGGKESVIESCMTSMQSESPVADAVDPFDAMSVKHEQKTVFTPPPEYALTVAAAVTMKDAVNAADAVPSTGPLASLDALIESPELRGIEAAEASTSDQMTQTVDGGTVFDAVEDSEREMIIPQSLDNSINPNNACLAEPVQEEHVKPLLIAAAPVPPDGHALMPVEAIETSAGMVADRYMENGLDVTRDLSEIFSLSPQECHGADAPEDVAVCYGEDDTPEPLPEHIEFGSENIPRAFPWGKRADHDGIPSLGLGDSQELAPGDLQCEPPIIAFRPATEDGFPSQEARIYTLHSDSTLDSDDDCEEVVPTAAASHAIAFCTTAEAALTETPKESFQIRGVEVAIEIPREMLRDARFMKEEQLLKSAGILAAQVLKEHRELTADPAADPFLLWDDIRKILVERLQREGKGVGDSVRLAVL